MIRKFIKFDGEYFEIHTDELLYVSNCECGGFQCNFSYDSKEYKELLKKCKKVESEMISNFNELIEMSKENR